MALRQKQLFHERDHSSVQTTRLDHKLRRDSGLSWCVRRDLGPSGYQPWFQVDVHGELTALLLVTIDTDAVQTGAGTTASCLGMADVGIAQLHDMRVNAEMIANLDPFGPPLIADMDTGYGGE